MPEQDQFDIVQKIVDLALTGIEPGWKELLLSYHVDNGRSYFTNTYIVPEGDGLREKSGNMAPDMDVVLRQLRQHLAQGGKAPFSSLKLHLFANGSFETSYGHDEVNWPALFHQGWQFFPESANGYRAG